MVDGHKCERCSEFTTLKISTKISVDTPADNIWFLVCDRCYQSFRLWLYGVDCDK